MIEVTNIRVPLKRAGETEKSAHAALRRELSKSLGLREAALDGVMLRKRSVDARKKNNIVLVYSVRLELAPSQETELVGAGKARKVESDSKLWPKANSTLTHRMTHDTERAFAHQQNDRAPLVVGAGCAGLFCALALARAGLAPILIERGDDAQRRAALIERHNACGELDCESNIQFGLGGAGTFSDGKLSTGTRSELHRLILEELVSSGAPPRILWDGAPHIGSDILPSVVSEIVRQIEAAGGTVLFRTRLSDIDIVDGRVRAVCVEKNQIERRINCSNLVLACGHSARDVYALLHEHGVCLERKAFAMGVRIECLQSQVNTALYGAYAQHPLLGAAPFKASVHLGSGRSAFTFCMCPGGQVVSAASEAGGVCTNGASLSARDGQNANAGLLVGINPDDFGGTDVLGGIELQRRCEQSAFELGGGAFVAPAQLVGDFCAQRKSHGAQTVRPSYPRGVRWDILDDCLPRYVINTLRESIPLMGQKLPFLSADDSVLTGVETRSSSPVRIVRTSDGQSLTTQGLWPTGEGAGYAGGIMSAAADGIACAQHIIEACI